MLTRPTPPEPPAAPTPDLATDAELVELIAGGSEAALGQMYDRHASTIYAAVMRLTNDRSEAEDVVQETFLTLWNRAESFDGTRGSARKWLVAIARNRAIDRARTVARSRVGASTFSSMAPDTESDTDNGDWIVGRGSLVGTGAVPRPPEQTLVDRERGAAVQAALANLDEPERQVIMLAYGEDLSQSEIAERLQWPLGTVKTRTRRALQHLRSALEDEADGCRTQARLANSRVAARALSCCG